MRVRLLPSRRLAVLFVIALGAVIGSALFGESARVPLRTPFVPRAGRSTPASVPLEGREAQRGSWIFRLELMTNEPAAFVAHEEVQLFFESASTPRPLVGARLELRGTGCTLVAGARSDLASRQPVVFHRSRGCAGLPTWAVPAPVDLVVDVLGSGSVALAGFVRPAAAEPTPLQVAAARTWPELDVRGAFVDYPATAPRIVLLNHMWRGGAEIGWLVALAGLGVALACVGCAVFPTQPLAATRPSATAIARAAAGASLFAASLGVLHAVLEPPLSGPDEPYHLLGFAELTGNAALADDTVRWMGETHLWRIRQQPAERFRTIDVGRPYVVPDDQLRPTEVAMRSATLATWWRAAAPVARGEPAHRTLLALRLINAAVFSVAVGVAATLAVLLITEPSPQWLVFPFLFVPALPFFAVHVSETALLCAIYILLALAVATVSLDGPRVHWVGAPLGLATGLMLASGRSPWPMVTLVAALLAGRAAIGGCDAHARWRSAVIFWGGFGLGSTVFASTVNDAYRMMTEGYARYAADFLPWWLRAFGLWLLAHPGAVVLLAPLGLAVEVALSRPREQIAARLAPGARRVVKWASTGMALAVVLSLVGSLVFSYPQLPTQETYSMPFAERLAAVLATMATMFRLTDANFLLASSFWVGFGWLDTIPEPRMQGLLMALVGLTLVALLRHIARHGQVRRFLWLLITAAGAMAALAFYTAATQDRISTLVGRHLIGWYLSVLAVIGGALTLGYPPTADGSPSAQAASTRAATLLVVAGLVHAYCLTFVLERYF